jgi:nucleoside-diphosphate-sugar epimerase
MANIALIGGSGFIGTNIVPLLQAAGHGVRIIDIAPSAAFPPLRVAGDVRDVEQMKAACAGCDAIINLAAAHRDDVKPFNMYYDVNVTGAANVCAAAVALGINRIVFTSSVAVYGHQYTPPDEDAPHQPINEYGRTKSLAEVEYRKWFDGAEGRNLAIVRPTVVFGIGNRGNVYTLLRQIASPLFVMIGDGSNRKAMAYVENIAAFIVHMLAQNGLTIANYVDGPHLTTRELVVMARTALGKRGTGPAVPRWLGWCAGAAFDALAAVTKRNFPISRVRVEKFCAETIFKADRVSVLGFTPPYDLQAGLRRMIAAEFSNAHV